MKVARRHSRRRLGIGNFILKAETQKPDEGNLQHGSRQPVHQLGLHRSAQRRRRQISMAGRGRYLGNIFIERLWRSLKYEAVYLHELSDGFTAERVIAEWIGFYNTVRPHSVFDGRTPQEVYRLT